MIKLSRETWISWLFGFVAFCAVGAVARTYGVSFWWRFPMQCAASTIVERFTVGWLRKGREAAKDAQATQR